MNKTHERSRCSNLGAVGKSDKQHARSPDAHCESALPANESTSKLMHRGNTLAPRVKRSSSDIFIHVKSSRVSHGVKRASVAIGRRLLSTEYPHTLGGQLKCCSQGYGRGGLFLSDTSAHSLHTNWNVKRNLENNHMMIRSESGRLLRGIYAISNTGMEENTYPFYTKLTLCICVQKTLFHMLELVFECSFYKIYHVLVQALGCNLAPLAHPRQSRTPCSAFMSWWLDFLSR